jgi:ubiquinone biosynthesis protein COQ9
MKHPEKKSDPLDALRDKILQAALPHIAFEGWSAKAAKLGAAAAGLKAGDAVRAFPRGGRDLAAHLPDWVDRQMLAALEKRELESMRVRDRITLAVRLRLEPMGRYREAVRRWVALAALPGNAPMATRALYRSVDRMWRAAGDTSTDFNFYTKRGLLAGVYVSTLLYWLDDKSEGSDSSWAFLSRRVDDVMQVPKRLGQLRERAAMAMKFAGPLAEFLRSRRSAGKEGKTRAR